MTKIETGICWSIEGGWLVFVTAQGSTHYFTPSFARLLGRYDDDNEYSAVWESARQCADECEQLTRDGVTGEEYARIKGKHYDA